MLMKAQPQRDGDGVAQPPLGGGSGSFGGGTDKIRATGRAAEAGLERVVAKADLPKPRC